MYIQRVCVPVCGCILCVGVLLVCVRACVTRYRHMYVCICTYIGTHTHLLPSFSLLTPMYVHIYIHTHASSFLSPPRPLARARNGQNSSIATSQMVLGGAEEGRRVVVAGLVGGVGEGCVGRELIRDQAVERWLEMRVCFSMVG